MTLSTLRKGDSADARTTLFHPVENTILSEWLGVKQPVNTPDFSDLEPQPYEDSGLNYVTLRHEYTGDEESDNALSDAVARIALKPVERHLPQFMAFNRGCLGD